MQKNSIKALHSKGNPFEAAKRQYNHKNVVQRIYQKNKSNNNGHENVEPNKSKWPNHSGSLETNMSVITAPA